jgi:Glycine zipper
MSGIETTNNYYPTGVEYREPRPRGTTLAALFGGLLGYAITENSAGAVAGGAIGGAVGSVPPPLEVAVRQYFEQNDIRIRRQRLKMSGFYRTGSRSIKITVGLGHSYWAIESHAAFNEGWTQESVEDWLYGDLVFVQLPKFINQMELRAGSRIR